MQNEQRKKDKERQCKKNKEIRTKIEGKRQR